jgi:hypothetical protein
MGEEVEVSSGKTNLVEEGSISERYLKECLKITRFVVGLKSLITPLCSSEHPTK